VADLTLVGQYSDTKWTSNPNVLLEYGYALKVLDWARIIPVINTHYGVPAQLPFHLSHRIIRVQYTLAPNATSEEKQQSRKNLARMMQREIELIWKEILSGGLTEAALKMAEFLVTTSKCGLARDPVISQHLGQALTIDEDQVRRAVDELEGQGLIKRRSVIGDSAPDVSLTPELFLRFDTLFMGWDPVEDALRVAKDLVTGPRPEANQISASEIIARYGWEPRRLNLALLLLVKNNLVKPSAILDNTFAFAAISETSETRRFARGLIDG
jgi:hypothetical protein